MRVEFVNPILFSASNTAAAGDAATLCITDIFVNPLLNTFKCKHRAK